MGHPLDTSGIPYRLQRYLAELHSSALLELCQDKRRAVFRPFWERALHEVSALPNSAELQARGGFDVGVDRGAVTIKAELTPEERQALLRAVNLLIPWRKGPFNLCGLELDAEWRSDLKWNRIAPQLDDLKGKRVLDIGSSTGYYMFRMLEREPEFVLGVEPAERSWLSFQLINRLIGAENVSTELIGFSEASLFGPFFDVVLCMGILYHVKDPLTALKQIGAAMKPGAQIIVESMAIPGDAPVALCPRDRYAKMRNVFFVPTAECLRSWVERAGFKEVELFSEERCAATEQRSTAFAPGESLSDFLMFDGLHTVEGYPAPLRVALKARKSVSARLHDPLSD